MTHKLPPNLLQLFSPRPPLRYLPASDHPQEGRKTNNIGGLAAFLPALQEYKEVVPIIPGESWFERKERLKAEQRESAVSVLKEGAERSEIFPLSTCELRSLADTRSSEPDDDPNVRGDAFKTLFVARLSYDTTEKDLEREFGRFGPIERIRIVVDITTASNGINGDHKSDENQQPKKKEKPHRGYAFIVYEREKDMKGTASLCPHLNTEYGIFLPTKKQTAFESKTAESLSMWREDAPLKAGDHAGLVVD
ncbi:uncharacterized protein KY384_004877 [Bacidia gigantensis]|uniref:uncharacterized protein n=1 Tax=Bacidia gigantensis TaxID=2732470 RepID=UPI001D03DEDE|nr:uncharacterized protein KY384_004877 [Bacidia gigantensis]KAG8530375.1 hypothetical protein KY384_004877 [Bacidia gigantensis]